MGLRLRHKAKVSSSVELTGNEEPISKQLNPSKLHASDAFRSSALCALNLPQVPSQSSTPSLYLKQAASTEEVRIQPSPQSLHTSFYSPSHSPLPGPAIRSHSNPRTKLVLPDSLSNPFKPERKELPSFRTRLNQAKESIQVHLPTKPSHPSLKLTPFIPYTYKDYLKVQAKGKLRLGGLGPASVDTEDWRQKMRLREQAHLYAKMARIRNEKK